MNTYPQFNFKASIGDVVSVKKGWFTHVGVVVLRGILQNHPGGREGVISWMEFSGGKPVHIQPMHLDPWVVMTRVQAILAAPQAYDAISQNCEHTVYHVTRGKRESPQLAGLVFGVALGAMIVGILSN